MKENERNELFSAITEQWEKRTTKHLNTKENENCEGK